MRAWLLASSLVGVLGASACASARAEGPLVPVPLEVPPVPPRIIVPEIEEIAPAPPPEPAPANTRPAPQRQDPPAKPPETDPPKTAEPPRQAEPPRVRTPQTANDEAAEREVRAVMGRAQAMLQAVNLNARDRAAKQQFDTAKRFLAQAENALRIRNYVFARNLADKAETLARQLGK